MEWKEFEATFPIQLNEQQKEAVQSTEGPVLLLAVPGSGKTTVLVTRLGYMIYCKGIRPERILTVTYTVAATKDMRQRFSTRFGEELAGRLEFRTINGICARIIQYYGRRIGKTPFELVKDEKETAKMLVKICQEHGMGYPAESDLKNVRTLITYIKNMMLTEEEIQKLEEKEEIKIAGIYQSYCQQMRKANLMDYDDQMLYAYKMLRMDRELLAYFQNLYPYICVDEAQDTSKIQHAIIALLASKTKNLFMVGDEDQSIYGFRAAYPEALLSFETHYPGAKVLLMEENFRSNANIVKAADTFIQKNTMRHEKHMYAAREAKEPVKEIRLKSRRAQYAYLLKIARDCSEKTAVLYRDNECAIPLIDLLERHNIPYRMRNAELTFFTHRTVLDIQNIIRFALDPKDTELFLQIYYRLKTFIKKEEAIRIAKISREKDIPVLEAAVKYGQLESYTAENIRTLDRQMKLMLKEPGDKAVNRILQLMGYQEYLKRSGANGSKLEIVKTIGRLTESPEKLLERLEELKLIIQEKKTDYNCPFILSTIHASKGLEYETVYLMDVVDGILPEKVPGSIYRAEKEEIETYEEERRLFYVGVTRAKDQLNVFAIQKPSKFCSELLGKAGVRESVREERAGRTEHGIYGEKQKAGYRKNHKVDFYMDNGSRKLEKNRNTGKNYQELAEELGAGVIVRHKKFGQGVVTDMDDDYVRIQFGDTVKSMDLKILARLGVLEIKND